MISLLLSKDIIIPRKIVSLRTFIVAGQGAGLPLHKANRFFRINVIGIGIIKTQ